MSSETVLITGASSGIGKELALCLAADGSRLVLVARSGGALESLADELRKANKVDARVLVADLARPEAPTQLLSQLKTTGSKWMCSSTTPVSALRAGSPNCRWSANSRWCRSTSRPW